MISGRWARAGITQERGAGGWREEPRGDLGEDHAARREQRAQRPWGRSGPGAFEEQEGHPGGWGAASWGRLGREQGGNHQIWEGPVGRRTSR